ncbi:MAG: phage tail protein, partial [Nitrospiraceae bacterium]|nr:phage tail protein [Nitrospiraceae bacterium]
ATSAGRNTDLTLTFENDRFQAYPYLIQIGDTFPFEAAICRIYEVYLDANGSPSQPVLLFKGVLDQPTEIDLFVFKCKVSMMPFFMDKRWKQTLVTLTNYPNAYEDTGKYLPIVYGQSVLLPAVRTDWGARTTLALAVTAGQATLEMSDASRFPSSGSVCIDQETISYTSISGNSLNGITRGANGTAAQPHAAGADVWQYQAVYDSIIAAHELSEITYIFAEYQGKLWLVNSGITSSVDPNGFTHLQFSDVIYVNGVLDYIGLDNTLSITDPGHSHASAASGNFIPNYATLSFPSGGAWTGAAASVYDQASNTGASASWAGQGTATVTADFPAYAGPAPTAVYFCITHQSGGGYAPSISGHGLDNGGNVVTQKINIGTSVPPYVQPQKYADGGNYTGCYWNVYEIWLEIETGTTGTSATGVSQAGTVSKTGTALQTHMIERLHAFVSGYQDDANGTYTGIPNSVIQTPDAVIKHFLCVASGEVFNMANDMDPESFTSAASAYAGYASGGYRMAFVIDSLIKPSEFVQKLAFQCRSVLTYDAGLWHLNPVPDAAPAPVRTINRNDLAGKNAMFKFSKTDWKNIWNDITVSYARLYSRVNLHNSDWLGSLDVSDASSQSLYGLMPKTNLQFECIRDQATAQSVLDHVLLEMKAPHLVVEFTVFWENFDLTVGQTIAISNDLWEGKLFFIQQITRKDQMTADIKAVGWW